MFESIAKSHSGACAMIIKREDDGVKFLGTGFLCHSSGYVFTCAHVISLTDELGIVPPNNINNFNPETKKETTYIPVTVSQYDAESDVCLLKLSEEHHSNVPNDLVSENENDLAVGQSILCLGYPFGGNGQHNLKLTSGILSSKVIDKNGVKKIYLDAMIHDGNSGGPVIEARTGKIIAVVTGRVSPTGSEGAGVYIGNYAVGSESSIGVATTSSYIRQLLREEGVSND